MSMWMQRLNAQVHDEDLRRAAQQARLARQAVAGRPKPPSLPGRLLRWLAHCLLAVARLSQPAARSSATTTLVIGRHTH